MTERVGRIVVVIGQPQTCPDVCPDGTGPGGRGGGRMGLAVERPKCGLSEIQ